MRHPWMVILVTLMAAGQQTPPPVTAQPAGTTPKYSANSNLVIVDVTVKDKSGNAIDTLSQNDFIVLEDGKPQKVDIFERQKLTLEPEAPDRPPALGGKNEFPAPPNKVIPSEGATRIQCHDKPLIPLFFHFYIMDRIDKHCAQLEPLKC